jgi:hypothetical protein
MRAQKKSPELMFQLRRHRKTRLRGLAARLKIGKDNPVDVASQQYRIAVGRIHN